MTRDSLETQLAMVAMLTPSKVNARLAITCLAELNWEFGNELYSHPLFGLAFSSMLEASLLSKGRPPHPDPATRARFLTLSCHLRALDSGSSYSATWEKYAEDFGMKAVRKMPNFDWRHAIYDLRALLRLGAKRDLAELRKFGITLEYLDSLEARLSANKDCKK